MGIRLISFLICFFGFVLGLSGQEDSTTLELGQLGLGDLKGNTNIEEDQKMISGGRFLQRKDDLPFTAFIITKDEILDNGYITLTDVLRSLPGMRVSQPGSGQEGETFMLRGLLGNSHMKILLDDNPIKPTLVRGMPIGAQLPIRQAERIEVIYGPSGALYGADASAGVINIITKQSERPVFAQADLSVGSPGYSSIDVMFGGKLGKDKHILRYTLYGSNTVMNNRRIFYDLDGVYNTMEYTLPQGGMPDTMFTFNPNYLGTATEPIIGKSPHLSRLFGMHLYYKIIRLSGQLMYRRDHSAIGLSPLASSYADPNNYFGENIARLNLDVSKDYKKWGLKTHLNYLQYFMDENSSITPIEDKLLRAIRNLARNINDPTVEEQIINTAIEKYFSKTRYMHGNSYDIRAEQLFYIQPNKFLNLTFGGNANYSFGTLPLNYLPDKFIRIESTLNNLNESHVYFPEKFSRLEWYGFLQGQFNFEKFRGIVGYQFSGNPYRIHLPQIALFYKVKENLNLRASYGRALRIPSPFYQANTYEIDITNPDILERSDFILEPEITNGAELGMRWEINKKIKGDVSVFYTQTENFISFNFDDEEDFDDGETDFIQGYLNDGDAFARLYGVQTHLEWEQKWDRLKMNSVLSLNYNQGMEKLPAGKGALDEVRGQPPFMAKFNLSFRFWEESIYLSFVNILMSSHLSTRIFSENRYNQNNALWTNDGFYTLDVITRYKVSKNFRGYVKVKNVFNRKYAGIDATGTIDDLNYNPQSLRTLSFGLSYRIE